MKFSDDHRRSTNIEDLRGTLPIDAYKEIFKHIEKLSISETEKIKMYITNLNAFVDRSTNPTDWVIAFDSEKLLGVMYRILNYLKDQPDSPLKQKTLFNLLNNNNFLQADHVYRLHNNIIFNILTSHPDKTGVSSMLQSFGVSPAEQISIINLPIAQQTQILVSKFLEIKNEIDNKGGKAIKFDDAVLKEFIDKFVYNDLAQKIASLRRETSEVRIQFRRTLTELLNTKLNNPTYLNYVRASFDKEFDKLYKTPIENTMSIDDVQDTVDIIKSKNIFNFLPESIRNKIGNLFDSLNDTHIIIGVGIVLLVISPIIYFVFFRRISVKVKARYGINVNELNMLYNMYFNFWKTDKIRFELYNDDYNKYKNDMYEQYTTFYYLVYSLNQYFKNALLNDIKTGIFILDFCPIKNYKFFRLPESEINKTIYLLFVSSTKLTKQDFYSLLKF